MSPGLKSREYSQLLSSSGEISISNHSRLLLCNEYNEFSSYPYQDPCATLHLTLGEQDIRRAAASNGPEFMHPRFQHARFKHTGCSCSRNSSTFEHTGSHTPVNDVCVNRPLGPRGPSARFFGRRADRFFRRTDRQVNHFSRIYDCDQLPCNVT